MSTSKNFFKFLEPKLKKFFFFFNGDDPTVRGKTDNVREK